jgi:hypothetical protein
MLADASRQRFVHLLDGQRLTFEPAEAWPRG